LVQADVWREDGSLVVFPHTEKSILAAALVDPVEEKLHAYDGVAVVEDNDKQKEAEETWRDFNECIQ